ncbi:hypothetical protein AB0M05_38775 [Streptomyces violaceusniger]|uniref:hypothetical protein n=1 Tax=Streptomyces violaceusniger TaxID=68280 RepID=UPI0034299A3E
MGEHKAPGQPPYGNKDTLQAYRLPTLERAEELLALPGCRRQQAGELSGGTRQKLNLLIALMGFFLIIMLSLVDTGLQNPVFKSSWM